MKKNRERKKSLSMKIFLGILGVIGCVVASYILAMGIYSLISSSFILGINLLWLVMLAGILPTFVVSTIMFIRSIKIESNYDLEENEEQYKMMRNKLFIVNSNDKGNTKENDINVDKKLSVNYDEMYTDYGIMPVQHIEGESYLSIKGYTRKRTMYNRYK